MRKAFLKSVEEVLIVLLLLSFLPVLAEEGGTEYRSADYNRDMTVEEIFDAETDERTNLIIFLYDKCGGCGTESVGCGNCKDTVRLHGILKKSLGQRLYDEDFHFVFLNTRVSKYIHGCEAFMERYEVPAWVNEHWPVIFLLKGDRCVWLCSEEGFSEVAYRLEQFESGMDCETIQSEVIETCREWGFEIPEDAEE